jgi:hypothetical protein
MLFSHQLLTLELILKKMSLAAKRATVGGVAHPSFWGFMYYLANDGAILGTYY